MASNDPDERTLISKLAAHRRWAKCDDPTAATAPAREGLANRFEYEVDPDGVLDPAARARRAEAARKAYFTELALKSHQARQARRRAEQLEAEVQNALVAAGRSA